MINLVKFNRRWEDCLFQMAEGSPAGRDIIEMLPPSAVGITRASQAETIFCKMLNMKGATWD